MEQFSKDCISQGGTEITVYAMIPEITPPGRADAGRYHANGYAALMELNALLTENFAPHDVSGQNIKLNFDGRRRMVDNLFLYDNHNIRTEGKDGAYIDIPYYISSFTELPQMVSGFVYSGIFHEHNDNFEILRRIYSFYDIEDWRVEYYEKAKKNAIVPYRTKAVSSFGFKRIYFPEEEIIEYFSFTFGRQSLLQMRYNNWNDDLGYRDTPANKDFYSEVAGAQLQEKWRMTDKHLMLEVPILPSDNQKFGPFVAYWSNIIPRWSQLAEKEKQPLAKLEELCAKGYNGLFRQVGAVQFYEGKTAAREQHAQEICDCIEHYIFEQWKVGDLSLYNMLQLIDCIAEEVDKKRKNMEAGVENNRKEVEQLIQMREQNKKKFAGALIQSLVKGKSLAKHSDIMLQLEVKQCEVLGGEFAQQLLKVLAVKLYLLRKRIETFVTTIKEAIDNNEYKIADFCNDKDVNDNCQKPFIRFYDKKRVKEFTLEIITSQKLTKCIAHDVLLELADRIGSEQTFAHANAVIDIDTFADLMDTIVRTKSIAIHEDVLIEASEKIINRSILEQLAERYNSEESLWAFAKSLIEESGVFLELNPAELQRAVGGQNNPVPVQGQTINRKIVLINLPKVEGNETVQKFAGKLKNALENAVEAGTEVKVDMSGSRKNELTVQAITYCFPIRCLKNLEFYKEKYDGLINGESGKQMQLILHTEGTGEDFPTLEVQNELLGSQLRDMFMPYVIACYAIDYIRFGDLMDGTGLEAWGTVDKDPLLGLETLKALAGTFTEIGYSPVFTEELGEELKDKYEEIASSTLMNVEMRKQAMVPKIQSLLDTVILSECSNDHNSALFLEFAGWTKKALAIISDPTPIVRQQAPASNNFGGIDFGSLLG